jgi:DNA-binding response OmpR family regulator
MANVLLVSDDSATLSKLINMLETMSYEVAVATSEFEVSRVCTVTAPRVVIADIETAAGIGFEAIATARRILREACIIAISREDHQDLWPKVAKACGANEYVVGPLSVVTLAMAIESCLGNPLTEGVVLQ